MSLPMSDGDVFVAIVGLTIITVVTRSFFFISKQEPVLPGWLKEGLRFAPLAALMAVIAPEMVMSQGQLIHTWQDARLFAATAAALYFFWRRGILGTIVTGMVVLLPLRLIWGW